MRKSSMALAALTLAVLAGSSLNASFANHCRGTKASPASAHDPFGSCEEGGGFSSKGNVKCGSGNGWQPIGGASGTPQVAKVNADASKGAQFCNDGTGNPAAPYIIQGRATAYYSGTNLVIAADGDKDNTGGFQNQTSASGWNRVDVRPTDATCKVRMRRGQASGNYWNTSSGATTTPDAGTGPQNTCIP